MEWIKQKVRHLNIFPLKNYFKSKQQWRGLWGCAPTKPTIWGSLICKIKISL